MIEHFITECCRYERQKARLVEDIVGTIGEPQWQIRREEVDRGIHAVLGVYDGKEEKERIIKRIKQKSFVHAWLNTREFRC